MIFPAYLLILLGLGLLLLVACGGYYLLYRRHVRRALARPNADRRPMMPPLHAAALLTILFLLAVAGIGFLVGAGAGYRALEEPEDSQFDVNAFYAEVLAVDGDTLTVEGLDLNGTAYRGTMTLRLYPGLPMEQDGQHLSAADLKTGDLVSVLLVTDAAGVEDLFKIQLLRGAP